MSEMPVLGGGHAFPETSNVPWHGAKPVYHFVYKLRQSSNWREREKGLPPKSLVLFKQKEPVGKTASKDPSDIFPIATAIASQDGFGYKEHNSSSVHINLREQCWIILELDRKTNWRFSTSHAAITTKHPEPKVMDGDTRLFGFNTDLHYVFVTPEGVRIERDRDRFPKEEDCHIVFFRMTHRRPDETVGMNFAVELYGSRQGGDRKGYALSPIPLIIDPDVPNTGDGHDDGG
jgi:hypothetical protein